MHGKHFFRKIDRRGRSGVHPWVLSGRCNTVPATSVAIARVYVLSYGIKKQLGSNIQRSKLLREQLRFEANEYSLIVLDTSTRQSEKSA
jgi:hypothetical protein